VVPELGQITCPGCGANLGASQESGEYHCAFCGQVSHAGRLRPVYGAREGILADMQRQADAQSREAAERAERDRLREEERDRTLSAKKRSNARLLLVVGLGLAVVALATLGYAFWVH
jgi:uncharacterized Zn finger protein (UPF0148 family)